MIKLQTLVFPKIALHADQSMYVRTVSGEPLVLMSEQAVNLPSGAVISLDTFFNGFSVVSWKDNCDFSDLGFALCGQGRVAVRFGHYTIDYAQRLDNSVRAREAKSGTVIEPKDAHFRRWIGEAIVDLAESPANIAIDKWPELTGGMLFVEIVALSAAHISGGYFYTNSTPQTDVSLGVVVTHFNRKQFVIPAIERISSELLSDPDLQGRISLVVVDNSQNILPEEAGKAVVIPNQNLGGAGGFTRGLLHLKDNGFTHCLFMDDDATCEIESIRRTYRIMQFARRPETAVVGSMLRELLPHMIHEVGATLGYRGWWPLRSGLDSRKIDDLLFAETSQKDIGYGGWWHFGFRIDVVKHFPFPFFVRGDDVLFSLMNPFKMMAMNGIGVWADDFSSKESPFIRYLAIRSTLVILLVALKANKRKFLYLMRRTARNSLFLYNYSSARAGVIALEHVLQGPEFWEKNMDMVAVRAEIAEKCPGEKFEDMDIPFVYNLKKTKENKLRRTVRRLSLNGFLLPSFMIRNRTVTDLSFFAGSIVRAFRTKTMRYVLPTMDKGFVAHHDKKAFFSTFFHMHRTVFRARRDFDTLRQAYSDKIDHLTSEAFWRDVYKLKK